MCIPLLALALHAAVGESSELCETAQAPNPATAKTVAQSHESAGASADPFADLAESAKPSSLLNGENTTVNGEFWVNTITRLRVKNRNGSGTLKQVLTHRPPGPPPATP